MLRPSKIGHQIMLLIPDNALYSQSDRYAAWLGMTYLRPNRPQDRFALQAECGIAADWLSTAFLYLTRKNIASRP